MAADGQIVLGLDISETKSQIESDLSSVLGTVKAKQLVIKTAIDKQETEKAVKSVVDELNQQTANIGLKIDSRDVTTVLNQQTKIATKQADLNRQMKEYQELAQKAGLTLKQVNLDKFDQAIKVDNFEAAKESIRAVKKEIDQFNVSVDKMYGDTKIYFDIESTVKQFEQLKTKSKEAADMLNQLKNAQKSFDDPNVGTQDKLRVYENMKSILGELDLEYKRIKASEDAIARDTALNKHIEDARTMLTNLENTYTSLGSSDAASKLSTSIQALKDALGGVTKGATGTKLAEDWENVSAAVDMARRAVSEYRAEQAGLTKQNNEIEKMINLLTQMNTYSLPETDFAQKLKKRIEDTQKEALELQKTLESLSPSDEAGLKNFNDKLDELRTKFRDLQKESKPFASSDTWDKFQQKIDRARRSVEEYDQKFSAIKGNPELVNQLEQLREQASKISSEADLSAFNRDFAKFDRQVQDLGLHTKSLSDRFKEAFKNFSYFFSASRIIYELVSDVRQMVTNVKDLDSAMVELRKVTEATDAEFKQFFADAKDDAVELGVTVKDLINATSQFSRLGYTLPESQELGRIAAMYLNVGDDVTSIDQASKSLVSTMKGFNMTADQSMSIVDKFNEVGNRFAISSGGIGDALQRSAAALFAANNTIDESIALIVAANNVIQDPDQVGTMWKTVAMRIRGATLELEQAGLETEGMAKSTASLRDTIMQLTNVDGTGGFDIMLDENTFKSTYDIILGIGKVWKDIADVDQAALLELLAGKRQGNALAAALTNLEDLQKSLDVAANSAGSAQKEYDVWLTSLEAKINQFKAAFEALSDTVVDSDLIKGAVDFGTELLTLLDNIIERFGGLGTLLANIASIIALLNVTKTIDVFQNGISRIDVAIDRVGKKFKDVKAAIDLVKDGSAQGGNAVTKFANALTGLNGAAVVTASVLAAVAVAITIGIAVYKKHQQELEETRRAAIEAGNAAADQSDKIRELALRYMDLTKALEDGTGSVEDATSARDDLVDALDLEKNKLDELIEKYGDYKTAIIEATKEALSSQTTIAAAGSQAAKDQAVSDLKQGFFGLSNEKSFSVGGDNVKDILAYLIGLGYEGIDNTGTKYGMINLPSVYRTNGDVAKATFDDLMADYEYIQKMMNDVTTKYGTDNDVAKKLNEYYTSYTSGLSDAIKAITTANATLTNEMIFAQKQISDPQTSADFQAFRDAVIKSVENDARYQQGNGTVEQVVDSVLRENEQYKAWLDELTVQEQTFSEIQSKREKLRQMMMQFAEIKNAGYTGGSALSQMYHDFIDDLSPDELNAAMASILDGTAQSLKDLQTIVETVKVPKLISGDKLSELREYYDELQKLNAQARMLGVDLDQTVYGNVGAIALDMQAIQNAADEAGVSVEALMTFLRQMTTYYEGSAASIRSTLSGLWDSEDFKTTRKEIEKLANAAGGVTVDAINKLADSSEVFRNILDQDGMSAEFLAKVLTQLGKGNMNALDLVTEDALRLNDALMGLEDSFGDVTSAKSKFDTAMKAGEKNDNFKSYAEAFQKLNDEFAAGTVNSNAFWAAAEYLFGADQLNEWGWADGLDEIYAAMKRNVEVFKDADSSGAGFLERLNEIADGGKVLDDDGNIIAEIAKLADGSYDFNIDASNLDALGEKMGLTREAVIACIQAISMFGDVNLFDINEVLDALTGASLAFETLSGTAVNLDGFIDQLTTLGKTDKEIYDLLKVLREVDGISFISASGSVDELTTSLKNLGLAVQDEDAFNVNVEGLSVLMEQLQFTKDEAENVIKKLSETDNVSLQNTNGEVVTLSDALSDLNEMDFATVKSDVGGIADALGGVNETSTQDAEDSLYGIQNAADLAKQEVEQLQTKIDGLKGKTVTISVDVQRKNSLLSMLGFAKGTDNAPETDAVVGERGEELIVGDGKAYLAGKNGAEIVHLNKGDIVYTAEETAKIKRGSNILQGSIPAYYDGRASGTINTGNNKYNAVISTTSSKKGKSGSSSSSKAETEFERLYKYHQHLLNMDQESTADYLDWLDAAYQEAYKKGEIELDDYYKYQEEVFNKYRGMLDDVRKEHENAITLNQNWLDQAISKQDYDGIRKYTGEIIAHYRAMQNELHAQAEYYRALGYSDTSDEVSKLSDLWWDYYNEIKNVSANAWSQIVDNANDAVDAIQGVYDTLHEAAVEYNENGYITVDTLQKILSWGVEYLDFLKDENGQLVINEDAIQNIIKARTEQMAVETALQYVESLRTAITDGNTEALNRLLFATQQTTTATWGLINAQLQSLGLNEQQYAAARQKVNAIYSLTQVAVQSVGKIDGALKKSLEKSQDALEDILKYVEAMIKQEVETQVKALENQVKSYKEIVDLQKKSLDLERKRDDYTKSVAEKTKELGELQVQIALIDLDKSREAQAQKAQLVERYAELQEDLADTQADYAYDTTVDALDDMYDEYSKSKDKEIETLKNTISSEEKLYQLAITRINEQWDTLYRDLIAWNTEYGSDTNQKLTEAWNNASLAVQQYGNYLSAVEAIQARINAMDSSSTSFTVPNVVAPSATIEDTVKTKVSRMKQNSADWHTNVNARSSLEAENKSLAEEISKLIGQKLEIRNGVWYLADGRKLYEAYPTYHSGTPSAGGGATLKEDELFAKLQKGEPVLNKQQKEGMFRILEDQETLLSQFGSLFDAAATSDLSSERMQEQIKTDAQNVQNNVDNHQSNMTITVPVQIHTVQKLDEAEIKQLSKTIGDKTIGMINESYYKRGKRLIRTPLKPD